MQVKLKIKYSHKLFTKFYLLYTVSRSLLLVALLPIALFSVYQDWELIRQNITFQLFSPYITFAAFFAFFEFASFYVVYDKLPQNGFLKVLIHSIFILALGGAGYNLLTNLVSGMVDPSLVAVLTPLAETNITLAQGLYSASSLLIAFLSALLQSFLIYYYCKRALNFVHAKEVKSSKATKKEKKEEKK
jgi:hypothetical protein